MPIKFAIAKPTATQKSLLLSIAAGIGVCITGVFASKCAKKTDEDMSLVEKAKTYAPAIVAGGATIGCIAASTYISHDEIAAVTAAGAALATRFANYKKSVEEVVTDEQREQIDISFYEKEIARLEEELAKRDHPTDEDDLLTFIDSFNGYTFKARKEQVDAGIAEARKLYEKNEYLYWCDVLFLVNNEDMIPYHTYFGPDGWYHDGWGWSKAMFQDLEMEDGFDIYLNPVKGRDGVYSIEYGCYPEPGFMEY